MPCCFFHQHTNGRSYLSLCWNHPSVLLHSSRRRAVVRLKDCASMWFAERSPCLSICAKLLKVCVCVSLSFSLYISLYIYVCIYIYLFFFSLFRALAYPVHVIDVDPRCWETSLKVIQALRRTTREQEPLNRFRFRHCVLQTYVMLWLRGCYPRI